MGQSVLPLATLSSLQGTVLCVFQPVVLQTVRTVQLTLQSVTFAVMAMVQMLAKRPVKVSSFSLLIDHCQNTADAHTLIVCRFGVGYNAGCWGMCDMGF